MVDFPRLPQISPKGRLPCEEFRCSACCHDTEMLLSVDDVARIQAARPGVDFHFQTDDGFLQLRTRTGPAAPGGKGAPCIFLDDAGRCSIHAIRPEGCRLYPAVWDGERGAAVLDADYCPHPDGFILSAQVRDAVRRLAERLLAEQEARAPASTQG